MTVCPRRSLQAVRVGVLVIMSLFANVNLAHDTGGSGELTKYQEMVLPSAEDLLRSKPFDWIVLKTDEVLVVEPVSPRPDPVQRLTWRQKQAEATYNRVLKYRPAKVAEIERRGRNREQNLEEIKQGPDSVLNAARDKMQEAKQAAQKIPVTLRDGGVEPEYLLETRHINFVVHYEDLLLRRADQLIEDGRVPLAYDLLLIVERRHLVNNTAIQTELESTERELASSIKQLDTERAKLRAERDELKTARKRITEIEKSIESWTNEMKELEEELLTVRKKLRFSRPKDFPKPDAPIKDDILLPAWPKFDESYQKLILKDAHLHAERGDLAGGLRLLEEIWNADKSVPELSARMGEMVERLIEPLVEAHDYRQARHYLNRLTSREPDHPVAQKWKADLIAKTSAAISEARSMASRGEFAAAVERIEQAARIWPESSGLKEAHRDLTDQYQIVHAGVLRLAGEPTNYPFPTEADEREKQFTDSPLFEPTRVEEQGVRYRSSYFESWEPTDLGRQVRFKLRLKRAAWESRPFITSADVYAELLQRLEPVSPQFDERLAGFIEGITIQSPSDFTVRFRRLPLRLESLWQFTVGLQYESLELNEELRSAKPENLGRQRFVRHSHQDGQVSYRRVRPQPQATKQRHVDEVFEHRYESWDKALQGLLRGEVTVLPQVDLREVKALQDDGRFFVIPYALPRSHLLLFQPANVALRDGQLRRALLHAIPRDRLLKEHILKDAPTSHARLVTGPFASGGYGRNRQLELPSYDPQLAAALALTAKKQLGGSLPVLKLISPPDPAMREISLSMISHWKRVGIEVTLVDESSPNETWDICYRATKFVEPVTEIWPLLTLQSEARVDALQVLPERTRRALLELERTIDWTTATKLLHRLLSDLLVEARYVPLWEVDEFLVTRRHLIGMPPRPMHSYDEVERWTMQSWYPQDTP